VEHKKTTQTEEEEPAMNITTIGLDIAKNVFQVHGVDPYGRVVVRKKLRRAEVLSFFANLPICLIGLEACAGAHYWARELMKLGHTVKLISPQFVKPYVKGNKPVLSLPKGTTPTMPKGFAKRSVARTGGLCRLRARSNKIF
jgi:transposase